MRGHVMNRALRRRTVVAAPVAVILALGGAAAAADAPEVVRVIAQGADVKTVAAAVHEVGGTVTRELKIIHAVAAAVTPAQERALAAHSAVEGVWRDGEVHAQDPEEQR